MSVIPASSRASASALWPTGMTAGESYKPRNCISDGYGHRKIARVAKIPKHSSAQDEKKGAGYEPAPLGFGDAFLGNSSHRAAGRGFGGPFRGAKVVSLQSAVAIEQL
jgi:hypothetical protein